MKTLTIILALLTQVAWADVGYKAPLKADFNAMITNTSKEKRVLEQTVQNNLEADETPAIEEVADDKQRVTDFIDAELRWGQAPAVVGGKSPAVVDRRFNSEGEAKIIYSEKDLKNL